MLCDLHTHTTASDGQYAPAALVQKAKDAGLTLLAVTDHDTVDGVAEALEAGERLGLRVVPGIEFSAREYHTFHILGYGIDPENAGMRELCRRMRDGRDQRKFRMLDYLRENGMELTLEEVEAVAGGQIIARPHFAQAMVRRGYVSNNREAFDRWLDTPAFHARVERPKPAAVECIDIIHGAGGWASLAHPYQIGLDDGALEALVAELKPRGLDAIECFYPKHTPEMQDFYLRLAEKYGLRVTGGSDFHGERVKPEVQLTGWPLEVDWLLSGENITA